ncbi:hypothetical protein JNK13_01245 [bacterium]|nr:hypothetical protein [bacterium]
MGIGLADIALFSLLLITGIYVFVRGNNKAAPYVAQGEPRKRREIVAADFSEPTKSGVFRVHEMLRATEKATRKTDERVIPVQDIFKTTDEAISALPDPFKTH